MVWNAINLPNLRENIQPTRERATLIFTKGADHRVESPGDSQGLTLPHADEATAGTPGHGLVIHVATLLADPRARGAKWNQVQPMSSQPVAMEPLARR